MSISELLANEATKTAKTQSPGVFPRKVAAPSSKPETQRAILIAALADGQSVIVNDLRCQETETMVEACRSLGARFEFCEDRVKVTGTGRRPVFKNTFIQAHGSGLAWRLLEREVTMYWPV